MSAPFVGPKPFGVENTIYGRDTEIAELRYYLGAKRIVLLSSPSGAGKSSLLNARNGLLSRMRQTGSFEIWGPARINQNPEPLTVANRFVWSAINEFDKRRPEGARPAATFADTTLAAYLEDRKPTKSPLLVFDQFEELLRLDPANRRPKEELFRQLGEVLADRQVWALFVIREDWVAALKPYVRMLPTHLQYRYRMNFLRRDQAMDAVVGPLEPFGRRFADGVAEELIDNLAKRKMLDGDEYVEEIGDYVEPLQLQLVGADLWSRIHARDAALPIVEGDIGDLNQALAAYYDTVVRRSDPNLERRIREWFDKRLISPDGVRNLIRKERMETAGMPNSEIDKLVTESYLVRQEFRTGSVWYELSHDRLTEPVRESNRAWFAARIGKLQEAAGLWEARGRSGSLVLVGPALTQARKEVTARQLRLTALDEEFLRESEKAHAGLVARNRVRALHVLAFGVAIGLGSIVCAMISGGALQGLFGTVGSLSFLSIPTSIAMWLSAGNPNAVQAQATRTGVGTEAFGTYVEVSADASMVADAGGHHDHSFDAAGDSGPGDGGHSQGFDGSG